MTRLIFCYRHVCCSFPSYPSDAPGSLCALRAIPLVFERERFPVLWFVLIRALRRREYVYKMLTTVSLSVTSDPVTSRSSTDTVPVSSFRLHVESDPGPVNRSTTRPKAVCQPNLPIMLASTVIVTFFTYANGCLCFVMVVAFFTKKRWSLYLYLFVENTSGIMTGKHMNLCMNNIW